MNGFKDVIVNSPIRWAGSKKKILNEMLNTFPKNKKNYIKKQRAGQLLQGNLLMPQ